MQLSRSQTWSLALIALLLAILVAPKFSSNQELVATSSAPSPMMEGALVKNTAVETYGEATADFAMDAGARLLEAPETATEGNGSEQRIIKQGDLSLLVNSVATTQLALQGVAKVHGGFVRDASIYEQNDKTLSGYAVIRVEAANFETAMADIRSLALNVTSENVSGTDVTEQFVDLEAQINNARAEERAYLSLLDRSGSVADLLKVQRELSNVRARIESMEGRLKYLSNQTDLATISVSLSEKPSLIAPTKDFRLADTVKEALQALVLAFQNVVRGLIWLVIFGVGALLPAGVVAWVIVRLWKRLR